MEIDQALSRLLQEIESINAAERDLSAATNAFTHLWSKIWRQHIDTLGQWYGLSITINGSKLYWTGLIVHTRPGTSQTEAMLNLIHGLPKAMEEVAAKLSHQREVLLKVTSLLRRINKALEPEAAVSVLQQ